MGLVSKVAAKFCCGGPKKSGARQGASSPRRTLALPRALTPQLALPRAVTPKQPVAVQWKALADAPSSPRGQEPPAAWRPPVAPAAADALLSEPKRRNTGVVDIATSGCLRRVSRTGSELSLEEGVVQMLGMLEPGGRLCDLAAPARAFGTTSLARRLLRKSDGNVRRASELFEQALRWCESHEELLKTRQHRLGNDERVMGLNTDGRPVIYLCMKNQMLSTAQCLDQKVCTMMRAIDCMPEGIENVVQIWDMHGLAFRASDLNLGPIIKEFQTQEAFFAERLFEIVIVGMPRFATVLKDIAWPFVPERTKKKIRFLADDAAAERYLMGTCDEKLSGRLMATMRDNRDSSMTIEQRKSSWQCLNQNGQLVHLAAGALP